MEFIISNTSYSAEELLPLWQMGFKNIDDRISFSILDPSSISIKFPNLDALINYMAFFMPNSI
jgi:hypothetical protein